MKLHAPGIFASLEYCAHLNALEISLIRGDISRD
jgi:hypothetical protein